MTHQASSEPPGKGFHSYIYLAEEGTLGTFFHCCFFFFLGFSMLVPWPVWRGGGQKHKRGSPSPCTGKDEVDNMAGSCFITSY